MALDPAYCTIPRVTGTILNAAIETALDTPTKATTVFTPAANGSLLLEVDATVVAASLLPQTAAGFIYLFTKTGGVWTLFDTIQVTAVTATLSTAAPWRATPKQYPGGIPMPSGTTLEAAYSVVPVTGTFRVTCIGLDA